MKTTKQYEILSFPNWSFLSYYSHQLWFNFSGTMVWKMLSFSKYDGKCDRGVRSQIFRDVGPHRLARILNYNVLFWKRESFHLAFIRRRICVNVSFSKKNSDKEIYFHCCEIETKTRSIVNAFSVTNKNVQLLENVRK